MVGSWCAAAFCSGKAWPSVHSCLTNKEHYSRAALPVEQSVVSVSSAPKRACVCVCVCVCVCGCGCGGVYVLVEQ